MMALKISVAGLAATAARLDRLAETARRRVEERLAEAGEDIALGAADRVRRQRDSERPLPSALAESLSVETAAGGVRVIADAPHAAFVELGTARMAAEPFLEPAFEDAVADLARLFPFESPR